MENAPDRTTNYQVEQATNSLEQKERARGAAGTNKRGHKQPSHRAGYVYGWTLGRAARAGRSATHRLTTRSRRPSQPSRPR